MFGRNLAPAGWMFCSGQLLPISENETLFQLIVTTYSDNGQSNFALPNFQGGAPMQPGQGPCLPQHFLGESSRSQIVILLETEIPGHTHTMKRNDSDGTSPTPAGNMFSGPGANGEIFWYKAGLPNGTMRADAAGITGTSPPHYNIMPYQTLNYCIALQGYIHQEPEIKNQRYRKNPIPLNYNFFK